MANTIDNLKKIHQLQKEGTILEMLRSVRNSKNDVELFATRIAQRKKALAKAKEEAELAEQLEEQKQQEVEEEKIEPATVQEEPQQESAQSQTITRVFDQPKQAQNVRENRPYERNERSDRNERNERGDRNNFSQNKRFPQKDRQQGQFNKFNNNRNGSNSGYGNNYNGSSSPRQNNFNKDARGQKQGTNHFVSTKANSFKSFDEPNFDVKQERNYGNKNKTIKRQVSEERSARRRGEDNSRSIFIEGENGIEEASFGSRKTGGKKKKETSAVVAPAITRAVMTSREFTVKELSEKIGKPVAELVKKLMLLGVMATINSTIDFDTAELVASDLGVTLELKLDKTFEEKLVEGLANSEQEGQLEKRPPIVAVMGHVDHGKTSLLDAFRKTNVALGEAGGITQKIGAYQIEFNGEKITFIDTPGHAAFTQMRARGAKATDIAILVVAGDDGIMPQTIEAINHIKAAGVPMIVAINKMDKPDASADRVKQQLTEHGVLPEEWGGDTICVPISAKTGMGLEQLKQTILLVAEMQDLKASKTGAATGVIIEAELSKSRGPVANIIVQSGTLKVGDFVMSGITFGKVRAMYNERGESVKTAGPSTPVSVLGFNEVPSSGDIVYAANEGLSKHVIEERIDKIKKERAKETSGVTLDNFMNKVHEGTLKNLNIILKADTMGSVEAIRDSLLPIANEEAKVNIVHSGTGAVTESDVVLAQTTGAIIICFNLKAASKIQSLADSLKVQLKDYKIIYEIIDDVTRAINGMLTVKYEEQYIGRAELRVAFKLSSVGRVAGCYVTDGKVTRGSIAHVKRGQEEIGVSPVESLKIVKDEKAEVAKGYECGIKLREDIDFKEGDILEFFVNVPIERK